MFNPKNFEAMKKYLFALTMLAMPVFCSAQAVQPAKKKVTSQKVDTKSSKDMKTLKKDAALEPLSTMPDKKVTGNPVEPKTETGKDNKKKADSKVLKNSARPTNATKIKEVK